MCFQLPFDTLYRIFPTAIRMGNVYSDNRDDKKWGLFSVVAVFLLAASILVLIATQTSSLVWSRALLRTGKGAYAVTAHLSLNPTVGCIQAFLDQEGVGKLISRAEVQARLPSSLPVSNSYKDGKIVDFCGPIDHRLVSILASLSDGFEHNLDLSTSDMIVTVMQLIIFGLWLSFSTLLLSLLLILFLISSPSSSVIPVCKSCIAVPVSLLTAICSITLSSVFSITFVLGTWAGIHDRFFKRQDISGIQGILASGFYVLVAAIVSACCGIALMMIIAHKEANDLPPTIPVLPIILQPLPQHPVIPSVSWGNEEALLAMDSCEIVSPPSTTSSRARST